MTAEPPTHESARCPTCGAISVSAVVQVAGSVQTVWHRDAPGHVWMVRWMEVAA